ncbi:major capsid protein [Lacrimispora sp.]|uniref:major capsid protein n=1 Tax=Lacrimispora sp. TaxID=2719234 RepID=UPI00289B59F6|nr:major capsid protein [Lacrimispora sp.]
MQLSEVFSSNSVALNRTEVESNKIPYLGIQFFPNKKKMGIDLKWIKIHKGLGVTLKASSFDAKPTIRSREGFKIEKTQMAFFRESMIVKEEDMMEIMRIRESNDPYVEPVLQSIYDDTNNLVDGADIVAERMRMQLLATDGGSPKIYLEADETTYEYNYDPDGSYKTNHYLKLSGDATWDKPSTSKPLNDLRRAKKTLTSIGVTPKFALMTSATFDYLLESAQIKSAILAQNATANIFLDDEMLADFFTKKTKLIPLLYDKMYIKEDGMTQESFYPDNKVTLLPSEDSTLGNTWYGTTPEERTLIGDSKVDVTILDRGVAIAVKTDPGPPVAVSTSVSQIVLPSYEGMDSTFVIEVA